MKKSVCILLSLMLVLCYFPMGVFAVEGTENVNYALGAEYSYDSGVVFKEKYEDSDETLLTDGNISYVETEGSTVLFQGTYQVVTLTMDLGEDKDDIGRIVFRSVNDTQVDVNRYGNRGFSKDKTQFHFSTDGINFDSSSDFVLTFEEKNNDKFGYYLDYTFSFNAPTSARYVKIIMYSPVFILSLGEIEIYGGDFSGDENGSISEDSSDFSSEDVSEEISEDISEDISDDLTDDFYNSTYRVNYALGAEYTYEEENPYLSEYKDTEKMLLTDGKTSYKHKIGEIVSYTGTGELITLIIDLNAVRDDIESVYFGGILNTHLKLGQNRGFSEDDTRFFFSTDGVNYNRNKSFSMIRTEKEGEIEGFYDYEFKFDAPISARYVKITMFSPVYLLALSEIEILGSEETVVAKEEGFSMPDWRYTENGTLVLSGEWIDDGNSYIHPWIHYKNTIKSVVVEDGVSYLGGFKDYPELEEVYMASSVKSFVNFSRCEKLYNIRLSKNITVIPDWAFWDCVSLENINLHEGLVSILGDSFEGCVNIKEVILPSTLEELGFLAFANCTSLENVELNSKIEKITGTALFETKIYNDKSNWDGNVFYFEDIVMNAPWYNTDGEITIKEGTRVIAADAFMDLQNLKKITIPDTVEFIGNGAFYNCALLEDVNIPDGIKEISPYTFGCCFELKEITLPECITSIGENAFTGSGLEKITIPNFVEYIGSEAFAYCLNLSNITFGVKNVNISNRAFFECQSLKDVIIPKTVISIGKQAFGYYLDEIQKDYVIYGTPGSEAENYALENGIKFVDVLTIGEFYLNVESKTLPNLKTQTTVAKIKSNIAVSEITDKNGKLLLETDLVGTGCIIVLENGEKFIAVVSGDVNGDSKIGSTDYMMVKSAFYEMILLENEYLASADMNTDNEITSTDYLKIKSLFYLD